MLFALCALALTVIEAGAAPTLTAARERLSLDRGWLFHLGDVATPELIGHDATYNNAKAGNAGGAAATSYDDSAWRKLDLPHDWAVEGPFDLKSNMSQGYRPRGVGWYRRYLKIDASAQYWATARASDGAFDSSGMRPGTYDMKVYKNELAVAWGTVSVAAGATTTLVPIAIAGDPASITPVWRIGTWDGSPVELMNGTRVTSMHPSDVRLSPWAAPAFVVGTSSAAASFPA